MFQVAPPRDVTCVCVWVSAVQSQLEMMRGTNAFAALLSGLALLRAGSSAATSLQANVFVCGTAVHSLIDRFLETVRMAIKARVFAS